MEIIAIDPTADDIDNAEANNLETMTGIKNLPDIQMSGVTKKSKP